MGNSPLILTTKPTSWVNLSSPPPPEASLEDLIGYNYPPELELLPITTTEIRKAILGAPGKKAPGTDGIANLVLHLALPHILHRLTILFNACLTMGYCPKHFRNSATVVLRKPAKEDYSQVKSYRLIALLNTLGKALDKILANRISYLAKKYGLLPRTHRGDRKQTSTEHAVHGLVEQIHAAWINGEVASMLLLGVSGAFDYVSHPRLIHNLQKRRIDKGITNWIQSVLRGRRTVIQLDGPTSESIEVNTGISQGSPLSPILYLFYNADLLDVCEDVGLATSANGFIDDASVIMSSPSTEENCRRIKLIYTRCEDWARKHASKFAPTKYEWIHFSRNRRHDLKKGLALGHGTTAITITLKEACRFLGIILDSGLKWKAHLRHIQVRASGRIGALASLAGSTWGASLKSSRAIYQAMILPQVTYCCSVWYTPEGEAGHQPMMLRALTSIQSRAARLIEGAFRMTSIPAMDVETFLLPMRYTLEKHITASYLRLASSPLMREISRIQNGAHMALYGNNWNINAIRNSPLEKTKHRIETRLGLSLDTLKKQLPCIVPPWWTPPHTHIAVNKEAAERNLKEIMGSSAPPVAVYTDGSGINNGIGASAVMKIPASWKWKEAAYLRSDRIATVYTGELYGIRIALRIQLQRQRQHQRQKSSFSPTIRLLYKPFKTRKINQGKAYCDPLSLQLTLWGRRKSL